MKIRLLLAFCLALLAGCDKPVEPPAPPRPTLIKVVGDSGVSNSMVLVGEVPSDDVLGLGRISASMWFESRLALYGVEVES